MCSNIRVDLAEDILLHLPRELTTHGLPFVIGVISHRMPDYIVKWREKKLYKSYPIAIIYECDITQHIRMAKRQTGIMRFYSISFWNDSLSDILNFIGFFFSVDVKPFYKLLIVKM